MFLRTLAKNLDLWRSAFDGYPPGFNPMVVYASNNELAMWLLLDAELLKRSTHG